MEHIGFRATSLLSVPTQQANIDFANSSTNTTFRLRLRLHVHKITSNRRGLVSSYFANVFWLLIYLVSFNRSVIEIHQKFLSVHSP